MTVTTTTIFGSHSHLTFWEGGTLYFSIRWQRPYFLGNGKQVNLVRWANKHCSVRWGVRREPENQTSTACLLSVSVWLMDKHTALHWSTAHSLTFSPSSEVVGGWWFMACLVVKMGEEALNKPLSGYPTWRGILIAWLPCVCLHVRVQMQKSYFLFWRLPAWTLTMALPLHD